MFCSGIHYVNLQFLFTVGNWLWWLRGWLFHKPSTAIGYYQNMVVSVWMFIYLFIWFDAVTAYKQIMPRLTTALPVTWKINSSSSSKKKLVRELEVLKRFIKEDKILFWNLVSGLAHELLGRFFPDGRHRYDPADVFVEDARLRLVGQLLDGVVPEEPQRMREDGQRLDRLTVAGRKLRVRVQVLVTAQPRQRKIIRHFRQNTVLFDIRKTTMDWPCFETQRTFTRNYWRQNER